MYKINLFICWLLFLLSACKPSQTRTIKHYPALTPLDSFKMRLETHFISDVQLAKEKSINARPEKIRPEKTPLEKVAKISENGVVLDFYYRANHDRIKTVLQQNNGFTTETRLFFKDYEIQKTATSTRHLHYINTPVGLADIIVKEQGTYGGSTFYTHHVVYTDHLGSINLVTNLNGTVLHLRNYDAWGRERNPLNWTFTNVPAPHPYLYRGFTGHEHLPHFSLINMNGRLYDPVIGRMLSPDKYVADATSTQAYNRYTYANNNPLAVIDPDGNLPVILVPIIYGAMIGAFGSFVAEGMAGGSVKSMIGASLKGAVVGAIIGGISGLGIQLAELTAPSSFWGKAGMWLGKAVSNVTNFGLKVTNYATTFGATSTVLGNLGFGLQKDPFDNFQRIVVGLFYIDKNRASWQGIAQGVSRFTWELIQTNIGYSVAHVQNMAGNVNRVEFFGGATVLNLKRALAGYTIGHTISGEGMSVYDSDGNLRNWFVHEYGHTLQSHNYGLSYLLAIALPSAWSQILDNTTGHDHDDYIAERGANRKADHYFSQYGGSKYNRQNILDGNGNITTSGFINNNPITTDGEENFWDLFRWTF